MTIIETKADELMALIQQTGEITTVDAAKKLNIQESYVRRLAYAFERRHLINLDATVFSLKMRKKVTVE